jgi:hypothetical protein
MNSVIGYLKEKGIFMISVIYGEADLNAYYERFGFTTMLCGQLQTREPEM